jgi:hypothetical protein
MNVLVNLPSNRLARMNPQAPPVTAPMAAPVMAQVAIVAPEISMVPPIHGTHAGVETTTAAPVRIDPAAPMAPPRIAPLRLPMMISACVSVSVVKGTLHLLGDDLFGFPAGLAFAAGAGVPDSGTQSSADLHPVIDTGDCIKREQFADGPDERAHDGVAHQVIDLQSLKAQTDPANEFSFLVARQTFMRSEQLFFKFVS